MQPLPIKHARRKFEASRDAHGVPHIEAGSWRNALYGLGYMHALDRPTQMLFSRAVAGGRSAEWIADKPELAETDRFFRRVGLARYLDREVDHLDDGAFGDMTAYCEGVNDGLKQSGRSLAMWATGFQKHPWDQRSVLLIGNLLNFGGLAVGQQQNERLLLDLIHAGVADDRLRELFEPLLDNADFDLLRQVKIASRLSDEALELIADLPRLIGSNAWAVSPARSATNSALLASDPHLEVNRLPAIWYESVLKFGQDYLMGASLPGCPTFAIGRTPRLAWGVTYLKGDTSDYFIEDCRRGGSGWQYRRGDKWHDMSVRVETLQHKGGPAETLRVYQTPQGTIEGDPEANGPGYYLAVAWTGESEGVGASMSTWLSLPVCATVQEAMNVVRECPQPTLVWVFADRQGHVGTQANGRFPLRRQGVSGLYPVPAWDERNHWQGWVPTRSLPHSYDPAEGFVASANEDINPADGPPLSSYHLPSYRKIRIDERLRELPRATILDMQALQYDVVSTQAREMLRVFLPHLPDGPTKTRLSNWNCSYDAASTEATLFSRLYRNVLLEVFGVDTAKDGGIGWRRMLYLCSRAGFSMMVVTAIDRLLHKEHSGWWRNRDKGDLIRRAAEKLAAESLAGETDQTWGQTNAFCFSNRFVAAPRVGRALGFHTADLPMQGCHATPFQGHLLRAAKRETTFAPSYHFVVDLAADEAWTNLPGGPSESPFSKWYKNEIPRWCAGEYKRLTPDP